MRPANRLAILRAVPNIARTRRPTPVVADLGPCGVRANFRPKAGDVGSASDVVRVHLWNHLGLSNLLSPETRTSEAREPQATRRWRATGRRYVAPSLFTRGR